MGVSVGGHNRVRNSSEEIAAAKRKLTANVLAAVLKAEMSIL